MRLTSYCKSTFLAAVFLAGFSPAWAADGDTVFFIVRHADKLNDSDNPPLSPAGHERAQQLMQTLKHLNVNSTYHTPLRRSIDTAKPLADELHIPMKPYAYVEPTQAWADSIVAAEKGKRTLIVGHSDTVHLIVNRLTGKNVPQISSYDNLFIVVISDSDKSVVRVKYGKAN